MRLRLLAGAALVVILLAACSDSGAERIDGVITSAGNLSVQELRPSDGLDRPDEDGDKIDKVNAVPCDEKHDEEAFAKVTYTGSDAYPDTKAMEKYATARCEAAYRPYVGKDY